MGKRSAISEFDILADVISADRGDLSPDVARSVLKWKFSSQTIRRINRFAERNRKGTISHADRENLQRYLRVGTLINLLQAKARLSLKPTRPRT